MSVLCFLSFLKICYFCFVFLFLFFSLVLIDCFQFLVICSLAFSFMSASLFLFDFVVSFVLGLVFLFFFLLFVVCELLLLFVFILGFTILLSFPCHFLFSPLFSGHALQLNGLLVPWSGVGLSSLG